VRKALTNIRKEKKIHESPKKVPSTLARQDVQPGCNDIMAFEGTHHAENHCPWPSYSDVKEYRRVT
jgi:hypothetical protein